MLPGALASPICLLPVAEPATTSVEPAANNENQAATAAASAAKNVMASMGLIDSAAAKKVTKPPVATTASQASEPAAESRAVPQFTLVVVVASRFLLIAEAINGQKAQDYQHMLTNILLALGDTAPPQYLPFSWPMINSSAVDQSAAVARSALKAFLKEHTPKRNAIIFGSAAQHLNLADTQVGVLQSLESLACNGLITACAAKAYAQPQLKRELWRHIAPLRLAE